MVSKSIKNLGKVPVHRRRGGVLVGGPICDQIGWLSSQNQCFKGLWVPSPPPPQTPWGRTGPLGGW